MNEVEQQLAAAVIRCYAVKPAACLTDMACWSSLFASAAKIIYSCVYCNPHAGPTAAASRHFHVPDQPVGRALSRVRRFCAKVVKMIE